MLELTTFEPWWRFAVALMIGALIGLEREFIQQKRGEPDFAGIRTFSLITLLGAVVAYLSDDLGQWLALAAFGGLILLAVASYLSASFRTRTEQGITTEVAVMLVFLLGAMVVWDRVEVAVALGVITALLLSLKGSLHDVVRRMNAQDLRVTLEFAIVGAVVLPILPRQPIDPLGLLIPSQIWLMVVFVSGIGFAGYVLMKVLGAEQGIGLAGLLGGIVSSTATTVSFSTRSKQAPALSAHFAQAILLASVMMFPRVLILVLFVNPALLAGVALPLAAMLLVGLASVVILKRRTAHAFDEQEGIELANPLKLGTAIAFGLVFAVVLTAVKLAQILFGSAGVYVASVIAGLSDVNAITLSLAGLALTGQIEMPVAGTAIVLAAVTNTLAKAAIVLSVGAAPLRRTALVAFGAIILVGMIGFTALLVSG